MRRATTTAAVSASALTLIMASIALAGGWANAIMDAPPDDPVSPGRPIAIGFTLLQHGVTPVDWGIAQVVLTNQATGRSVTFDSWPQGAIGHWVADISIPAEGTWSYEVRHDLAIEMTGFDPITVGPAAAQAAGAAARVGAQPGVLLAAGFLSLVAVAGATAGIVAFRHGRLDRGRVH